LTAPGPRRKIDGDAHDLLGRPGAGRVTWCGCLGALAADLAGAAPMSRRQALGGLAALAAAGCAPAVTPAQREAARALAARSLSVDLHSHPGMLRSSRTSIDGQVDRMARGGLRASLFAAVADAALIGVRPGGGLYATREPRPGELYASTYRQVEAVAARIAGARLGAVSAPADLDAGAPGPRPAAILAVEGGDFLEGRLDRVEEAHRRGIRSIQLVHYRVNELGDIQTEPPRHGGLTPFGRDVVREMNRRGMVVDLAHATFEGVKAAVEVSTRPMILSHTVLGVPWARAVSREHARLVADHGGVVGIFPVAIAGRGLSGYVDSIARMVEAIGPDHVGIGTDMDGISPPSFATFDDYAAWPTIPEALLARGFAPAEVAQVMGGNFLRVFTEITRT
jgi:membrane dipeptidase